MSDEGPLDFCLGLGVGYSETDERGLRASAKARQLVRSYSILFLAGPEPDATRLLTPSPLLA